MSCSDQPPTASPLPPWRAAARRRPGGLAAVVLYDLCEDQPFTATSLVASGLFDEFVLSGRDFESIGPGVQDLVIHAEGDNFTGNFSYRVSLQYRFKNGPWQTAVVLALQTSGVYVISNPFTDRSKLGMRIRVVLETQVTAGSSSAQHGNLTISAAARFFAA